MDKDYPNANIAQLLKRKLMASVICFAGYWVFYKLAIRFKKIGTTKEGAPPIFSWRTPVTFGNACRSPIFPYAARPFHQDFEKWLKFYRDWDVR